MTERALRAISIVATVLVGLSFVLFAADEFGRASVRQQTSVAGTGPVTRPHVHASSPRKVIDGSARALMSPFATLETFGGTWGRRVLPTALALLFYGFGLGYLANAARGLP